MTEQPVTLKKHRLGVRIRRYVLGRLWKPVVEARLRRTVGYRYRDLRLRIPPGVFHPGYFFSSRILAGFVSGFPLQGRTFLDMGCGSGLVALTAARCGAVVTAVDIHETAVAATRENAESNGLAVECLVSDLFSALAGKSFDVVAVNPPWYPKAPGDMAGHAWYAGEHFEYFHAFFSQLSSRSPVPAAVYMVLSNDCDVDTIDHIASQHRCSLQAVRTYRRWMESLTVFRVQEGSHENLPVSAFPAACCGAKPANIPGYFLWIEDSAQLAPRSFNTYLYSSG